MLEDRDEASPTATGILLPAPHCKNFTLSIRVPITRSKRCSSKSQREGGAACARASALIFFSLSLPSRSRARPRQEARVAAGWRESAREAPGWLPVWGREDWRRLECATLGEDAGGDLCSPSVSTPPIRLLIR